MIWRKRYGRLSTRLLRINLTDLGLLLMINFVPLSDRCQEVRRARVGPSLWPSLTVWPGEARAYPAVRHPTGERFARSISGTADTLPDCVD